MGSKLITLKKANMPRDIASLVKRTELKVKGTKRNIKLKREREKRENAV